MQRGVCTSGGLRVQMSGIDTGVVKPLQGSVCSASAALLLAAAGAALWRLPWQQEPR
jgi:hypothetical protein